jgi:hypothetical protein
MLLAAVCAGAAAADDQPRANPEATKMLADAIAARATWAHFPGFKADLEVNIDGKVWKTTVTIDSKADVTLKLEDEDAGRWAKRQLASLASHRLPGGDSEATCAFTDDVAHHPLGRAITVLNDEFHSSYRIRDRQVIEVNRQTKDNRFTITVMENHVNAEKKFLPSSYVVNWWDLKGTTLQRSDTHYQTWQRIGAYDLPVSLTVVSATPTGQTARSVKLSNHQLLPVRGTER